MSRLTPDQRESLLELPPDLVGTKQPDIPGFSEVIFPPPLGSYSPEAAAPLELARQRRQWLVKKIDGAGLAVKLTNDGQERTVLFRAEHYASQLKIVARLNPNQVLCRLNYHAGTVSKYYNLPPEERVRYEGFGIMQVALSLAIESLKSDPDIAEKTIGGFISCGNLPSLFSRLHAPNLAEGGYFRQEVIGFKSGFFFSNQAADYRVTTYFYESSLADEIRQLSRECRQKLTAGVDSLVNLK